MRDTQIAGICEARHAILATRNTRRSEDPSRPMANPWEDANTRAQLRIAQGSLDIDLQSTLAHHFREVRALSDAAIPSFRSALAIAASPVVPQQQP